MKVSGYKQLSKAEKLAFILNIFFILGLLLSYTSTYINPEKASFMAFFGLGYPFFLIPCLIFLIYWLVKRKKQFLWSLVAILIGFTHFSHFFQLTVFDRNEEEKINEIHIMTFNVRDFDLYEWIENEQTKVQIFAFLEKQNPDVICFQEFYHDNREHPRFVTRDSLIQFLQAKNYSEGYTQKGWEHGLFGNVTLSKYPVVGQGHIKFDNDKGNSFIYSDLLVAGDTIRVYNAHIGSAGLEQEDYQALGGDGNFKTWPHKKSKKEPKIYERLSTAFKKRVPQTRKLLDHAAKSPHPLVICGDFNDTPVSYNYRQLTKEYWDSFILSGNGIGSTYVNKYMRGLRIDYIFHEDFFNSYNYHTHDIELSDHRPVSTTLEF